MPRKKRPLNVPGWIRRQNAKLNRVEESRSSEPMGAGSHHLAALSMRKGFVKPKTIKKLESIAHKRKKKIVEGM